MTIPTVAEAWATYYKDAGYSVPTTTRDPPTSTFLAFNSTSISSTSTTMPAQIQSLNLPQSPSRQLDPTNEPKTTPGSTITTAISPREKASIGTAGALGALGIAGSLYLFRRSKKKRLERIRSELAPEVVRSEETESRRPNAQTQMNTTSDWPVETMHLGGRNELTELDGRTETDTSWGWLTHEAHVGGRNQLVGQGGKVKRAEMPG